MQCFRVVLLLTLFTINVCTSAKNDEIVKVRLESCPGCSLNRLSEVKSFFYEDVPKYENVEWKKISGAPPEMIFLNEADEEIERHILSRLTREECNRLLQSKGFKPTKDKEL
ncbi:hypothetical protein NQ315_017267 [Exocentrus adspersus]|uniref:Selenoprotein M n=1 Tax=Exocentrus adspersus TaxID=1586481 RepID=A0AAV8VG98_9CUCU|nr:hypothetical protein NQ315_017267 [Exocentrus adspersus]